LGGWRHTGRFIAIAGALSLLALQAHAGPADIDTVLLRPSFGPNGLLSVTGAQPGEQWTARAGSVLQYEYAPLVLLTGDTETALVVAHRVGLTVGGFLAVHDRVGIGVSIPLLWQRGELEEWRVQLVTAGDLRTELVWNLLRSSVVSGALTLRTHYPTSTPASFTGERWPRLAPGFVLEVGGPQGGGVLSAEVGVRAPVSTGFDLDVTTELAAVLGGRAALVPGDFDLFAELALRVVLGKEAAGATGKAPLDVRVGIRLFPIDQLAIDVGIGAGLNGGYGNSLVRALVGVSFIRKPPPERPRTAAPKAPEAKAPEPQAPEPQAPERIVIVRPPPRPPAESTSDFLLEDLPDALPEEDPCAPDVSPRFEAHFDEPEPPPPEEPGARAELREDLDKIEIKEPIQFAFDSDVLLPSAFEILDDVHAILVSRPDIALLVVEGHASVEGTAEYNWELSSRRSAAVFRYLVDAGVSPYRIAWRGMGETAPRADREGEEPLAENRRVEFRIEKWDTD